MMPAPARKTAATTTANTGHNSTTTPPAVNFASASGVIGRPPSASGTHHRALSFHEAAAASDSPADSHASPDDGGADGPEGLRTKKRKVGPGSRGVANLTPEQLAKKRANDREAQRAIRERTKHTIENLENRIKELTSQQPYQELQAALRDKETVEQELADVKSRMASILSIIQPVLGSPQGVYASPGPSYMPAQPDATVGVASASRVASTPPSTASPNSAGLSWQLPGMQSAGSSAQTSPHFDQVRMISQQRQNSLHALELGPGGEHLKLNFLLDGVPLPVNRMQTGDNSTLDSSGYHPVPMRHDWNGFTSTSQRASLFAQPSSGTPQNVSQPANYTSEPGSMPPAHDAGDAWAGNSSLVRNCGPTCPLDSLLLDFLNERRQRAAEGVSAHELVGPRYPSVSSLLNPQQSQNSHPVSKVFTDILGAFPGISKLPEKVAVLYIMFLIMRWQIFPSKENYDRLPSWCVPTPSQLQVPHAAWIDHLPFPDMREKISKAYRYPQAAPVEYPFNDFFVPFTDTLSLNWLYEETDVLIETPDGELLINPVFETHMKRQDNWTLGEQFDRTFPQLRGTYKLKRSPGTA